MRRRKFIGLLGGAAALWPRIAHAQQPAMPVIGLLHAGSRDMLPHVIAAMRQGLSATGYVEGQNVTIEYRWAEGRYERLPELAADLVRRHVAAIVTGGNASTLAAKVATSTIPIVFVYGDDPVRDGLAASFNRPGGNVTGVYMLSGALVVKQFEWLRELVPTAATIAFLVNPTNPNAAPQLQEMQKAAVTLGRELYALRVSAEREIAIAFATLVEQRASALVIPSDPFFTSQNDQIVALAARHAVPVISAFREYAVAGGLMSYGTSLADAYRQAGIYTGRILKGEKPADLPVQQSVKVELVINLKTAKALGLTVPLTLLGRADEVIE